jgi:hypothetical protein
MIAVASGSRAAPPAAAPAAPQIGTCQFVCSANGQAFSTLKACGIACHPMIYDQIC